MDFPIWQFPLPPLDALQYMLFAQIQPVKEIIKCDECCLQIWCLPTFMCLIDDGFRNSSLHHSLPYSKRLSFSISTLLYCCMRVCRLLPIRLLHFVCAESDAAYEMPQAMQRAQFGRDIYTRYDLASYICVISVLAYQHV